MFINSIVGDRELLDRVFTGFQTMMLGLKPEPNDWVSKLAMTVSSSSFEEEYLHSPDAVQMKEFAGEFSVTRTALFSRKIKNREFKGSIEVKRALLLASLRENKGLAAFEVQRAKLIDAQRTLTRKLLAEALISGTTTQEYDGQFIFDTSHLINPSKPGSGVQANLHAAKPLTAENFAAIRALRSARLDASGDVMGLRSNALIVPAHLEGVARQIVKNELGTSGGTNEWAGSAEIIVVDELAKDSLTSWYVGDIGGAVKPLLLQDMGASQFVALDDEKSDHVAKTGNCLYIASATLGAGISSWHMLDKAVAV